MRVHEYAFRSVTGASLPLDRWKGQPLLLVNTASECGYTPQLPKVEGLGIRRPRLGEVETV